MANLTAVPWFIVFSHVSPFKFPANQPTTSNPFTSRHFAHTVSQSSIFFYHIIYLPHGQFAKKQIGIKSTPDTLFLSHGIADNTIELTREDYLCQKTLQITLRTRIEEVDKKIAVISESSEGDERINPIIEEYVINENLFDFLLEEEWLSEIINNNKKLFMSSSIIVFLFM